MATWLRNLNRIIFHIEISPVQLNRAKNSVDSKTSNHSGRLFIRPAASGGSAHFRPFFPVEDYLCDRIELSREIKLVQSFRLSFPGDGVLPLMTQRSWCACLP